MCRLFETIKVLNGTVQNIEFHSKRFNRSRAMLFGCSDRRALQGFIRIPRDYLHGIVRCKVVYSTDVEAIEFARYNKRSIRTLRAINCDGIDYAHKYCDRSGIDRLVARRDGCDDIIIVKGNRITDSSFCNLVFDDGERLLTPASPLLKGTKCDMLVSEGSVLQEEIGPKDLRLFKVIHLINAMLDLDECRVSIDDVYR